MYFYQEFMQCSLKFFESSLEILGIPTKFEGISLIFLGKSLKNEEILFELSTAFHKK